MSGDEVLEENSCSNKRKADSDDESHHGPYKRERFSPTPEDLRPINYTRRNIEEAIQTLDRVQHELNMENVLLDSPETSDHDTPPESEDEDESGGEDMLNQAHALGFAACIRETFRFLDQCGIPKNDPIYEQLKSRFVETSN